MFSGTCEDMFCGFNPAICKDYYQHFTYSDRYNKSYIYTWTYTQKNWLLQCTDY